LKAAFDQPAVEHGLKIDSNAMDERPAAEQLLDASATHAPITRPPGTPAFLCNLRIISMERRRLPLISSHT